MGTWIQVEHHPRGGESQRVERYVRVWRTLQHTVLPKFKDYKLQDVKDMFREGGPREARWASNSDWVQSVKGFNAPLISKGGTGLGPDTLAGSLDVNWQTRGLGSGRVVHDIHHLSPMTYSAYLQQGYRSFTLTTKKARGRKSGKAGFLSVPIAGGGWIFRKSVTIGSQRGEMPARPHVIWTKDNIEKLSDMIADQIEAWGSDEASKN